jgi:hypothetical protein
VLCFLIFNFSFLIEANATIRYVSPTGNNIPPYLTWEDAANVIQDAINICEPGDTVLVANGVYAEKVTFNKFVNLIGLNQDSCLIDGTNELSEEVVRFNADGAMETLL